jgi:hypothetical protein
MSAHPAGPRHADGMAGNVTHADGMAGNVTHADGMAGNVTHADGVAGSVTAGSDSADLDPLIWPRTATRDQDGCLTIAGVAVTELATRYATPLFVMDAEDLRARAAEYAAAFADADVFYASKAFLCTAVAREVTEQGLGLDVCTGAELAIALRAGVDPSRIALHGTPGGGAGRGRADRARLVGGDCAAGRYRAG